MTIHSNLSGCPFVPINQMEECCINIDLGDMHVTSPMTGEIQSRMNGRNVLPIRVPEGETIPYRYTEVFKQLSRWKRTRSAVAYTKRLLMTITIWQPKTMRSKILITWPSLKGPNKTFHQNSFAPRSLSTSITDIFHRDLRLNPVTLFQWKMLAEIIQIWPTSIRWRFQVDGDLTAIRLDSNGFKTCTWWRTKGWIFNKVIRLVNNSIVMYEVFLGNRLTLRRPSL